MKVIKVFINTVIKAVICTSKKLCMCMCILYIYKTQTWIHNFFVQYNKKITQNTQNFYVFKIFF